MSTTLAADEYFVSKSREGLGTPYDTNIDPNIMEYTGEMYHIAPSIVRLDMGVDWVIVNEDDALILKGRHHDHF
jgi:hypothetical protein